MRRPWGFQVLEPLQDDKVIYSFHMYEPYAYNSRFNDGKYEYPGKIPTGERQQAAGVYWDKKQMENLLSPISEWQKKFNISSNRIWVGDERMMGL